MTCSEKCKMNGKNIGKPKTISAKGKQETIRKHEREVNSQSENT